MFLDETWPPPVEPIRTQRIERFGGNYMVDGNVVCHVAPAAVEALVHDLVRNASPNWETFHIECRRHQQFDAWQFMLRANGIPRIGGEGRG